MQFDCGQILAAICSALLLADRMATASGLSCTMEKGVTTLPVRLLWQVYNRLCLPQCLALQNQQLHSKKHILCSAQGESQASVGDLKEAPTLAAEIKISGVLVHPLHIQI